MEMLDLSKTTINADSFCRGCVTEEEKAAILRSVDWIAGNSLAFVPVFVEVGTLWGGTAEGIARVLLTLRRKAIVWTIDTKDWPGTSGRLDGFENPVELRSILATSWDVAPRIPQPIVWAFIDGDHCEAAVTHDIEAYAPRIAPGGLLLFHDTNHGRGQGVLKAIKNSQIIQRDYTLAHEVPPVDHYQNSPARPWGGLRIYQRKEEGDGNA